MTLYAVGPYEMPFKISVQHYRVCLIMQLWIQKHATALSLSTFQSLSVKPIK